MVLALALLVTGGAIGYAKYKPDGLVPDPLVVGTVLYAAPTANEQAIDLPAPVTDLVRQAADAKASFRLIRIEGDGSYISKVVDATPTLPDGEEAKVDARERQATNDLLANLKREINDIAALVPGESLFGGLQRITNLDVTKPIVLIASGLDTKAPFDFRALGFDGDVGHLVGQLRAQDELPKLDGATITLVIRGTAGDQAQLRTAQSDYRHHAWSTILKASGATTISFSYPEGGNPTVKVAAPVVPIPPPPDTPVVPERTPTGATCQLLGGTYFQPNKAVLLDRDKTLKAVAGCAAVIPSGARVTITGFTAGTDPNSDFTLTLSKQRAELVRGLLVELGIAEQNITTVGKGNSEERPYPKAPNDPRNRVVVITADLGPTSR
jgi:outer membrane protein OmpA-like peptidoglycan-associated protein